MGKSVLIIEDEQAIADSVAYNLKKENFQVYAVYDGSEGMMAARKYRPDLIILDIMLPGINGVELCRLIRKESQVPIIMLTARTEEIDKVLSLELGADDYITKPFSMRELIARVKAVLRRVSASVVVPDKETITYNNVTVDLSKHKVIVNEKEIDLTYKEFELLKTLIMNREKVLTRDVLLERIWGDEAFPDTRTVDVHIRWLREKIERDPGKPEKIVTVRGVGYKFVG